MSATDQTETQSPVTQRPAARCQRCGQTLPCPDSSEAEQARAIQQGWRILDVPWGMLQVLRQTELRLLSTLPLLLSVCLLAGGLFWGYERFEQGIRRLIESQLAPGILSSLLVTLSATLGIIGVLLLFGLLFLPLLGLIFLPFFDLLAVRTEALLLGQTRSTNSFQFSRLIPEILLLLGFKLVLLLPALLLLGLPVIGPFCFSLLLAMTVSLDFLDVIWMRRGYSFKEKLGFLGQNLAGWLLYLLPLLLMLWLPLIQVLMLPGAAVGAVRFYLNARK